MEDQPPNPIRFYWSEQYDGDPVLVERHDIEALLRACSQLLRECQQHDDPSAGVLLAVADLQRLLDTLPLRVRSLRDVLSSRPGSNGDVGDNGDDPRGS